LQPINRYGAGAARLEEHVLKIDGQNNCWSVGQRAETFGALRYCFRMPLFYFDIQDGDTFIPDEDGRWFADVEAAQLEAKAEVAELICCAGKEKAQIIVRDESGNTIAEAEAELKIIIKSHRHA
jgi:hypothetical protein